MRILINNDFDAFIKTKLFIYRKSSNNIRLNTNYKKLLNTEITDYINKCFNDSFSFKESLYRIYYNIENHPKCMFCDNYTQFDIYKKTLFREYCNNKKCIKKISVLHNKQTKLKKYGDENYNNREKCNETKLKLYGNKSYNNSKKMINTKKEKYGYYFINVNKAKQTKLERYGDEHYINLKKIQNTFLNKYGVSNILSKNSPIRNKIKQANIKKYGFYFVNINKAKQTKLERYGNENYNNVQKIQQTCLKRYGVNTIFKLPEISKKIANSEIRKLHEIETKRKNHTFNSSKSEEQSYKLLKQKYPDVLRQYKSELYPFNCDFYIPSLNIYIECQYGWTHGSHPYNKDNKDDSLIIEKWKVKNTKYYDNAINIWTIRDVQKRNIAKQNNLNYIEFWNLDELKKWILN